MSRIAVLVAVVSALAGVSGCTSSHPRSAAAPTTSPAGTTRPPAAMTLANAMTPSDAALRTVLTTAADVARPAPSPSSVAPSSVSPSSSRGSSDPGSSSPSPPVPVTRVRSTAVPPADDARVRTLITWCTHTSATEDPATTVYGSRLTVTGRHGPNTVYSYARSLPAGTRPEVAAYTARLVGCWQHVLLPVMAATLDPYIEHLTVRATSRPLPLPAPGYGSAQAVEGVIRWHPTPAKTEISRFDVAVVFGAHTQVTVLAAGADGLTTGVGHLRADLAALTGRVRAAEHSAPR